MEFTTDGEYKVGNTTSSTPIQIRIPEYGYELPEINSSSPIPIPIYTSVANIINWLDRGINVEFCDKKNAEKVFFFILEYNRYAENENKKIDNIDEKYKVASNAQTVLFRMIDFKNYTEKKKADEEIPFKHNLFKKNKNQQSSQFTSSYNNPNMKRNNQINSDNKPNETLSPLEITAYDIFSPSHEINIIESDPFKDINFT
jgi:hypothetical protein